MYSNGLFLGDISPTEILAGSIAVYEQVFPEPDRAVYEVELSVSNPESPLSWQRAETTDRGIEQAVRTNKAINITYCARQNDQTAQNLHNQIYALLGATIPRYAKMFSIQDLFYHEAYQMLKYDVGTEYKQHCDSGLSTRREVSAIVYLNDDYEGGELEFPHFNVKIKPKSGMLLLFPSNYAYAHIAHPISKGTKYALVTWIRDHPI